MTEQCTWYKPSREERTSEVKRGDDLIGTKNFEIAGCYMCTGFDTECLSYKLNSDRMDKAKSEVRE